VGDPVESISGYLTCSERGDLGAARSLFADDARFTIFSGRDVRVLASFDDFLTGSGRRREAMRESFAYRVDELLGGGRHAAALITFSRIKVGGREREWREVAVYRVEKGVIVDARAYEEPPEANASDPR
jgi:hypothetical protein